MASYVPCKKNDANGYVFYVSLVSQADTKIMKVSPTLAAGDVKIAVDDAAPGNLGTLPVVDADFTKRVKVTLSQAETNGDNLTIIFSDAAGAEWCDLTINIQTSTQTLDEIETDVAATHVHAAGAETEATAAHGHASTIDGHITADYGATEKTCVDLLDDAAGGLADIHTDVGTVAGGVGAVLADTAEIGVAGAGLTAVPWNAIWDAEVQSECADALVAYDPPTRAELTTDKNSIITEIDDLITRVKGLDAIYDSVALTALEATLTTMKQKVAGIFDRETDSLEAIRDRGDVAWVTGGAAPTVGQIADAVWDEIKAGHIVAGSYGVLLALEATLTAMKGVGWTNETLKYIKELVDALQKATFTL